jgi:predicted Zn-dependent protease
LLTSFLPHLRPLVSVTKKTLPILFAFSFALSALIVGEQTQAASNGTQPVLKAIDPSAAKLDVPPPPEATVDPGRKFNQSNPFNSAIQGRPLGSPPGNSGGQQYQSTPGSGMTAPGMNASGLMSPQIDQSQAPSMVSAADEQRVTRLEKQAFGNTYPEHEVDDRLEHLEKEVLGGKHDGQLTDRIARLEQKLLGGTAFGGAFGGTPIGQAAIPPSNMANGGYAPNNNLTPVNMSGNNYIPTSSYGTPGYGAPTYGAPAYSPAPPSGYPAPMAVAPYANNQAPYSNNAPYAAAGNGPLANQKLPNQSLPNQNSQSQAQRPQIPANHLPPGQVAMPPAWNTQPNFSPRAYGLAPAPSPVPGAIPASASGAGSASRPGFANGANPGKSATASGAKPAAVSRSQPPAPVASSLIIESSVVANSLNYDGQAGDYLGAIRRLSTSPNGAPVFARWRQFPVRVRLPLGSPESWQRNLEAVIARWDQYVPVKIALPSEPSNVDVLWVNQLPPKALGVCRLNIVNGQMQVWVYLLRPSFYAADVPERTLAGVFTREMGHALGLFGKSDKNTDLMYAAENGSSNLSVSSANGSSASAPAGAKKKAPVKFAGIGVRDINTLKRVYEAAPTPPSLSLSQPLEWATSY